VRSVSVAAVALASALTFCAQPLAAAASLPVFGGAASVWAATSVFFQLALLVGYGLAHLGVAWLGPHRQRWMHVGLLALAWTAFAAPSAAWNVAPSATDASAWGELWIRLGLPMVAIAGTTPALSRWLVERGERDPYPLYAASNIGSLGVLLAYPTLLEPALGRTIIWWAWWIGLGALCLLTLVCAWRLPPRHDATRPTPRTPTHLREGPRWAAWAALPSALLVADTVHLTTDLAPVPVLWVLPLAAYLGTWVVAFSTRGGTTTRLAMHVMPLAIAVITPLVLLEVSRPSLLIVGVHIAVLSVVGLAFHGALAANRPDPRGLTAYYGWLALGGAAGAALVNFVFPNVFDRMLDLPVLLVISLLAVRPATPRPGRRALILVALALTAVGAAVLLIARGPLRPDGSSVSAALFIPLLVIYALAPARPRAWSGVLAVVLAIGTWAVEERRQALVRVRSAYAAHRVVDHGGVRWLAHGRTIHGAVSLDERALVLPYHHDTSPAAAIVRDADRAMGDGTSGAIAIVGLGVGALARYAQAASVHFVEIDTEVVTLATAYFPFLDECGSRCTIEVADGRRAMSSPTVTYDTIVLDAFASDAIPTHLVTVEALRSYFDRLAPDGILAIHITNEHVDLGPILAASADELGVRIRESRWSRGDPAPSVPAAHLAETRFVALARNAVSLDRLGPRWHLLPAHEAAVAWTDDRVDLLSALRRERP
jgi:hypothetical protein